jgi:hypothetical protein
MKVAIMFGGLSLGLLLLAPRAGDAWPLDGYA